MADEWAEFEALPNAASGIRLPVSWPRAWGPQASPPQWQEPRLRPPWPHGRSGLAWAADNGSIDGGDDLLLDQLVLVDREVTYAGHPFDIDIFERATEARSLLHARAWSAGDIEVDIASDTAGQVGAEHRVEPDRQLHRNALLIEPRHDVGQAGRTGRMADQDDGLDAPAPVKRGRFVGDRGPGDMIVDGSADALLLQARCDRIHAEGEDVQHPAHQVDVRRCRRCRRRGARRQRQSGQNRHDRQCLQRAQPLCSADRKPGETHSSASNSVHDSLGMPHSYRGIASVFPSAMKDAHQNAFFRTSAAELQQTGPARYPR